MVRKLVVSVAACAAALSLAVTPTGSAAPSVSPAQASAPALPGLAFDPSFGAQGTVRCCAGLVARYDEIDVTAVGVRRGTVYLGGMANPPSIPVTLPLVAVYQDDGSPLPSFNHGRPRLIRATGDESSLSALLVRPDGRIVIVGLTQTRSRQYSGVFAVQLTSSGALDHRFAGDGSRLLPTHRATNVLAGLDTQGRLYVAASVSRPGPDTNPVGDVVVWRLRRHGAIDPSYGRHGRHVVDQRRCDVLSAMTVTPGGRLTVALLGMSLRQYDGTGPAPKEPPALLVQLTAAGRLDPSFSADGRVPFRVERASFTGPLGLQRDPHGRLMAGSLSEGFVGVRRWTPDGRPDPTYGTAGLSRAVVYPSGFMPNAARLTPRGYVLAGFDFSYGRDTWFVRFRPHGGLDPTFGNGGQGVVQLWPFLRNPMEIVETLAVDPRGRLLVAGTAGTGSSSTSWGALSRMLLS